MKLSHVLFVTMAFAGVAPAAASETGFAAIHDWRREGGRTCMVDHFHYGSGTGSTEKAAKASAIAAWSSFTVFEYGSTWGRYTLAAGKVMECQASGGWTCSVRARPCKR
ncbi:MAG: hypothetical protein NW215_00825 [Hyphomicrobiales bacterium]|nr:hypothetical protein [Hyphomicrobiales bacterium]